MTSPLPPALREDRTFRLRLLDGGDGKGEGRAGGPAAVQPEAATPSTSEEPAPPPPPDGGG
ncbi:MAG TPA: hypothetical protein VIR27_03155, partial [Mycobacteriales bacterium]